jgi:hypothetical protein
MDTYQVDIDDDRRLVHVTVCGEISKALGFEIITKARQAAAERGYSILCDVREVALQVALSDWFFLPRELEVLKDLETRFVKAAIVIPEDVQREYRFYETVAYNAGLTIRAFLKEDEALAWLK